jgi:hypothetical protein
MVVSPADETLFWADPLGAEYEAQGINQMAQGSILNHVCVENICILLVTLGYSPYNLEHF